MRAESMKVDHLIEEISGKTGISPDQARLAFVASLEFIKAKLPESVSSQLTGVLEGQAFDFNNVLKEQAQDKFEDLKEDAKEKFDDLREGAKGVMDKLF